MNVQQNGPKQVLVLVLVLPAVLLLPVVVLPVVLLVRGVQLREQQA